jgi:quercetin dioxygenase-like cupin family protein
MPEPFVINAMDRTPLKGRGDERAVTRFLGPTQDTGPWVYLTQRPAGERVPLHKHSANRTEFLIEGVIDWKEPQKPFVRYGAGTLSYVEAGTIYSYDVVEDATILLWFDSRPGTSFI